jgi:hypothetical protein
MDHSELKSFLDEKVQYNTLDFIDRSLYKFRIYFHKRRYRNCWSLSANNSLEIAQWSSETLIMMDLMGNAPTILSCPIKKRFGKTRNLWPSDFNAQDLSLHNEPENIYKPTSD